MGGTERMIELRSSEYSVVVGSRVDMMVHSDYLKRPKDIEKRKISPRSSSKKEKISFGL